MMNESFTIQGEEFRLVGITYSAEGQPMFCAEGMESGSLIEFRFLEVGE